MQVVIDELPTRRLWLRLRTLWYVCMTAPTLILVGACQTSDATNVIEVNRQYCSMTSPESLHQSSGDPTVG